MKQNAEPSISKPMHNSVRIIPNKGNIKAISQIALPVIAGMVSQNIFNLVDAAMVGKLGTAALAATGMGSYANFLCSAFVMGMAPAVQAIAARRKGEGKTHEAAIPLNGGLLLVAMIAIPLSALLSIYADLIFSFLVSDPKVVSLGESYLQLRLMAMLAMGINFAFRGYWTAMGTTKFYLYSLGVMHLANIVLNYLFIFGNYGFPELGVAGAGLASLVAAYVGTAFHIALGLKHSRVNGFLKGLPQKGSYRTMITLGASGGFQHLFFAAGLTTSMWIIGRIGTAELAAANVLTTLMLTGLLPAIGFGISAGSLVGQALGANHSNQAKSWGYQVCILGFTIIGLYSFPSVFFPDLILGLFLNEVETLKLARLPFQLTASFIAIDAIGLILQNVLMGAGDNKFTMKSSIIMQWMVYLPFALILQVFFSASLAVVWGAQLAYRIILMIIMVQRWVSGRWANHNI